MRNDMDKVVHERPRYGHRCSFKEVRNKKDFNSFDIEEMPYKESIDFRYKYFRANKKSNINHNPLLRFLQKHIGKNWDDVYSELCCSYKSVDGKSIDRFLKREIYIKDIFIGEDGGFYSIQFGYALRVDTRDTFYVDPLTKKLSKGIKEKYIRKQNKQNTYAVGNNIFEKHDGIWYVYKFKKYIPRYFEYNVGIYFYRQLVPVFCCYKNNNCISSDTHYAYVKKQLSHNELKRYDLVNDDVKS